MTHVKQAEALLRKADELAKDMSANGTAVVEALAHLAMAHIKFAATFGDSISD